MNVTVHRGDCLWSIAKEHGVSLKALIKANPQIDNPRLIHAGQVVHVPGDDFEKPKPKPKPRAPTPTTPTTAKQYQAHAVAHPTTVFKTQYRNATYNPTGPARSSNCGPASLAMAIKAYGLEPAGLTPEESIDRARRLMTGNENDRDPTNNRERLRGAKAAGLHARQISARSHLDDELAAGHMVMVVGDPGPAYKNVFAHYPKFEGLHSILVVGKAPDGRYVVADPVSHSGPRLMTRAQLHAFWQDGGGSGTAVWR